MDRKNAANCELRFTFMNNFLSCYDMEIEIMRKMEMEREIKKMREMRRGGDGDR
jgi:hypothetical protein